MNPRVRYTGAMLTTLPYIDDIEEESPPPGGPRLIVAMACNDPVRTHATWTGQCLDLDPVVSVQVVRGAEFECAQHEGVNGPEMRLAIPDPHVSRTHMTLVRVCQPAGVRTADDGWRVRDCKSTHGVWRNALGAVMLLLECQHGRGQGCRVAARVPAWEGPGLSCWR